MSICASKKVWKRLFELNELMPDCPPSPKMVTNQFVLPLPLPLLLLVKACVPLSWVPPMMSLSGSCALTERLWYWSVPSPLFSDEMVVGTFDSQLVQWMRLFGERPRPEHWPETSEKEPSSRQRPPSFAMKTMLGSSGVAAIACSSGCRLTPCVSIVMSVKLAPASAERWIARPFDRPPISLYCMAPPM